MNTETPKPSLSEILQEARQFHEAHDSLLMATSRQNEPVATYAPYVIDDQGRFYIYVSELSAHTPNLMENPRASLLFIEDESKAQHLFGRKRVTYTCAAEPVARDSDSFAMIMGRFRDKHGKFMDMMREMRDFHLFRLTPEYANYVRGFAQAYELHGDGLKDIRHVNDKGHRAGTAESAKQMDSLSKA
jgi:putative heme iron utilization protein